MDSGGILKDLLRRLQQSPDGQLLLGFDETKCWPAGMLAEFERQKLIRQTRPAQSLICPGCEEACCMPVVTIPGQQRAFIICDLRDDTSRVPVKLEQLQQWQLLRSAFYKFLSEQTGLTEQVLRSLPIVWSRAVSYDSQGLSIDSSYLLAIAATLQSTSSAPLPNRFVLAGDFWNLTFNQKTVMVKDTKGIKYIEYLIRNKGKEVHVSELFYAIDPPDVGLLDKTHSGMSEDEMEGYGLSLSGPNESSAAMTPDGKRRLEMHLKKLAERLEDAKECGDEDEQERLEEEQEKILQQLANDFGLRGKPRQSGSFVEQCRKNITNCINKDKKKLQESFPELAEHLNCLSTGTFCSYRPNPDIEWQ